MRTIRSTLLVSLDLSAAFDMVDHCTLLNDFSVVLEFLMSTHGLNPISKAGHSLCAWARTHQPWLHAPSVFPKDLSLGHYFFSIYTSLLSTISESHHVFQQQYADDTQLCVSVSPLNYHGELTTLESW